MRFRVLETDWDEEWGPDETIEEMDDGKIARFRLKKNAVLKMPGRLEDAHEVRLKDLDDAGISYRFSEILEAPDDADQEEMFQIWEEVHAKT